LISLSTRAQELNGFFNSTHKFLQTYVSDGNVDYKNISDNPAELYEILAKAKDINVSEEDKNTYKAFWINAYNLIVIKSIIDNYPLRSPLDLNGFFDKTKHYVGGESLTLNEIENDLLSAKFDDPRIHFVLVCGAKGCPPIINEAYTPDNLEEKLDEQTKKAINGPFIQLNHKKKKVLVSQIMEWYKKDFLQEGNEIDFLNKYLDEPIPSKYKLSYFTYDWSLNEK
jgi:hypothetical protein